MYFATQGGSVYHILTDADTGSALCGARMSRIDLLYLKSGKRSPQVVAEKPDDTPLCKHCEKHQTH
jgi:hypothetical protein